MSRLATVLVACVLLRTHGAVVAGAGTTVVVLLVAQTMFFTSEILVHSPGSSAASPRRSTVNLRAALDVDRDAPSILAVQGVAWLGIDATGKRRGTLAATP